MRSGSARRYQLIRPAGSSASKKHYPGTCVCLPLLHSVNLQHVRSHASELQPLRPYSQSVEIADDIFEICHEFSLKITCMSSCSSWTSSVSYDKKARGGLSEEICYWSIIARLRNRRVYREVSGCEWLLPVWKIPFRSMENYQYMISCSLAPHTIHCLRILPRPQMRMSERDTKETVVLK